MNIGGCELVLMEIEIFFAGKGLFVTNNFKAGDFLAEYRGDMIDAKEADEREKRYRSHKHGYLYHFSHGGKNMW